MTSESVLQQAVEFILAGNYSTRTVVGLQASLQSVLLFFLVVTLTAVGYDYSM